MLFVRAVGLFQGLIFVKMLGKVGKFTGMSSSLNSPTLSFKVHDVSL